MPEGRNAEVALSLMRMALALLDREDARTAAAALRHAIDIAEGKGPGGAVAQVDDGRLDEHGGV